MCWTASPATYWNMKGKKNNKSLRFKSRNLNKNLVKYTCWIVVVQQAYVMQKGRDNLWKLSILPIR